MAGELLLSWLIFSSIVMLLINASTRLSIGILMSSQGALVVFPATVTAVLPKQCCMHRSYY